MVRTEIEEQSVHTPALKRSRNASPRAAALRTDPRSCSRMEYRAQRSRRLRYSPIPTGRHGTEMADRQKTIGYAPNVN
jgi:hypothetical protein